MQNNYLVTFNRARCLLEVFRRLGTELGGCSKSGIPGLSAPLQLAIIRAQALPSPDGDTFEGGLRPKWLAGACALLLFVSGKQHGQRPDESLLFDAVYV